jgi:hypothetical protein
MGPYIQYQKIDPSKGLPGQGVGSPKKEPNPPECIPHQAVARIIPVIPVNEVDQTALIIYYKGPGTANTDTITKLVQEHIGYTIPHPAMVTQFYDHVSKEELPKWLLGFDLISEAEKYATDKDWPKLVLQYHRISLAIGKCGEI